MSNFLDITFLERSLVVRFARPESRNALSVAVLNDLERIVASLEGEDEVERVIFTGTDTIFASGANLNEIAVLEGPDAREFAECGQGLMRRIAELRQKTIAAVNGHCFGGALDLALACDHRLAVPTATFCHPGAGLGIITGWGGTQRLPRLVGEANALQMLFTAEPISAFEAVRIGLIDEIADNLVGKALSR